MSERSADAPTILICERHGFFLHASIGVQIGAFAHMTQTSVNH
ncbi:MAG TPA: hypothetical protein VF256_20625 [Streptosporangiaceae bacterium]